MQDVVALSGAHTVGYFERGIEQTGGHSQSWRAMDLTPETWDASEAAVPAAARWCLLPLPLLAAARRAGRAGMGWHAHHLTDLACMAWAAHNTPTALGCGTHKGLLPPPPSFPHSFLFPTLLPSSDYFQLVLKQRAAFTTDNALMTNRKAAAVSQPRQMHAQPAAARPVLARAVSGCGGCAALSLQVPAIACRRPHPHRMPLCPPRLAALLQLVRRFATDRRAFLSAFTDAYIKMGTIGAQWAPYP